MKTALYCRVSTDEQHTLNQKLRLEEYAIRNNYDFETFEETMSSRKTRPVKQALLQRLRAGEFDAVIIWKLDRWARSTYELLSEVNELYSKGVKFVSLSDNIDLSTATGKLQFSILSAFAEFERNLIRERTLEGLHRAKCQGKTLGRPAGTKDKTSRRKSDYYLRWFKPKAC
jgi:DNA invertase Pin-like site-specific DNA recombinase